MCEFFDQGLRFSCARCARCCATTPGIVFLSAEDLKNLAEWAELPEEKFIKAYCRFLEDDSGKSFLCLREKSNFDCIFWSEAGCEAYEARPVQCRTYPFWSKILRSRADWEGEKSRCPGIGAEGGRLFSKEEIKEQLDEYNGRKPLTREDVDKRFFL